MKDDAIRCPKCGHEFELTDALTQNIRDHLKAELELSVKQRELALAEHTKTLQAKVAELDRAQQVLDEQVEARLKKRMVEVEQGVARKAEERYADQMKSFQETIRQQTDDLKALRQQELDLRKKQREMDDRQAAMELEMARKLDAERDSIRQEIAKRAAEEHRLKDMEKDRKISQLLELLQEAQRKAEQGSMESQGEVLEEDFENHLKRFFPHDEVRPVPKGIRGADLIQVVRSPIGVECGTLLWELKNTKSWNAQWIPKLKDDMRETRARLAILVSVALPDSIGRFGQVEDVWVSDPLSAIPLAASLREQLLAVDRERVAAAGKSEKKEEMYRYLSGPEFKQKIEGIVEAFTSMQDQLNAERRAMEKQWKQREKQIERVVKNTVGLYGDMQGIIGSQIVPIAALELGIADMKQLPGKTGSESEIGSSAE